MNRISILASGAAFSLLAALVAQGCSSAEDDPGPAEQPNFNQGGTGTQLGGGQGGAAPAPTTSATGTVPVGQGGTPPTGGQGGTATGTGGTGAAMGMGGTGAAMGMGGTGAAPAPGTVCVGSVSNMGACPTAGPCTDLCGVKDLGQRVCNCAPGATGALAYACVGCAYMAANDPLLVPPTAALPVCTGTDAIMEALDTMAGFTCTDNDRCQSTGAANSAGRFCGCRGNSWDCDSKPDTFTF